MNAACSISVRGVVQGVGFRPFIYRLARTHALTGWVLNESEGVDIHLEGAETALQSFLHELETRAPVAACITAVDVQPAPYTGLSDFTIQMSRRNGSPASRIPPDLPVCSDCLAELFDPASPRYRYPYINCTNCGPRYSVIERLPYDRANTTMKHWLLDAYCEAQYSDPADRRFHAQPVACSNCGPHYNLESDGMRTQGGSAGLEAAVRLLNSGKIVAIKGIGGYHLACDARQEQAVRALRERKFRKEKPFAVMVPTLEVARKIAEVSPAAAALMESTGRPIVLLPALAALPDVAPGNCELGVMLAYAPLHYLLFESGAPEVLVMTSANRSSEPIAYEDDDARRRLSGLADAFFIGERPIARRVDDSVARVGAAGPALLRRSRGYAPGAAATLPVKTPILALGADLKNTITLAVHGDAFVSQHIGDLDHHEALQSFERTIRDLISMYDVRWEDVLLAHDLHPQYASTAHAPDLGARRLRAIQHHRAHIASVLAERGAWETPVVGVSFDGTGYGDDGTIWGGEFFYGSVARGFRREMHLRPAALAGGDAAARDPVQCAAGFLSQLDVPIDLAQPPFQFPEHYRVARALVEKQLRTFATTSMGRLFDACAALLGFTRKISFEGQAAIWLEQLARTSTSSVSYSFPIQGSTLDFRPLLAAILEDRSQNRNAADIARAFHRSVAQGLASAVRALCGARGTQIAVFSGGVFQNDLLLSEAMALCERARLQVWTNRVVPANDGGISLGQAAIAAFPEAGGPYA